MTKHQNLEDSLFKIASQIFGSLFACSLLYAVTPSEIIFSIADTTILGIPFDYETSILRMFFAEFFGSFLLLVFYFVLIVDVKNEKHIYSPAIAAVHFVLTLNCFQTSGAFLNLGRVIGYMLTSGNYFRWWVYLVAIPTGSVCGALLGNFLIPKVRRIDDNQMMSVNENFDVN